AVSSQLVAVVIAVPAALAIAIFFWSLDRVRKERKPTPATPSQPRATPRELVERLLRPAAESLSQRRTAGGRPTLAEDLGRAGLNITPAEYLLVRIGATALGALIGLFRFGISVEDALSSLLLRIDSPDLEFIVTAILLHVRVGGNLAEVLDNISDTLRDRLQTKRDMAVLTAQSRASATIITGLPILLALGLY